MNLIESYPAASWRPNQLEYCSLILDTVRQPNDARIGLEGPCGCGKSIGYLRAAMDPRCPPAVVLSTTRQHLQQIEDTLENHWPGGDWAILRGRSFYGCCDAPAGSRKIEDQDPDASQEHVGTKCPLGEGCHYRQAVIACGRAKVVVQCTIGHLYRRQYWQGQDPATAKDQELALARKLIVEREVVILDEAHEYIKVRREFETVRLSLYARTWLTGQTQAKLQAARVQRGGYKAAYVVLSDPRHAALKAAVKGDLTKQRDKVRIELDECNIDVQAKRLQTQLDKLETRLAVIDGTEDSAKVVSLQWNGDFADLVSEPARAYTQDKLARVEVFTSATLAPVAHLLNIAADAVTLYPEIFDWAGKVKLSPMPPEDPTDRKNYPMDPELVRSLYDQASRPTTILLAFSKAHAAAMASQLKGCPGVYLQGEDTEVSLGELVGQVKAAAARGERPFLITYGGWVGTDIPGHKWLILGSVPKSPLTAAAEGRALATRTSPWNDFERNAMDRLQLAQGLGRALRTPEDQAVLIWVNSQAARDAGLDARTGRLKA
jgi:Rad3-related DNA helicase